MKEQEKISEKDINETASWREFKIMVIKKLITLRRRMDEHSDIFNKKLENIRKYPTKVTEQKNTITELINILGR